MQPPGGSTGANHSVRFYYVARSIKRSSASRDSEQASTVALIVKTVAYNYFQTTIVNKLHITNGFL